MAEALYQEGLSFKQQVPIPLKFGEKVIGRYFADFIIEDKIVLELKKGSRVSRLHANQLIAYVKAAPLPLGILAYLGNNEVTFKRIINA